MMKEFKDFALKGNVMDMAVGVIIGGAFGKIVTSVIDDLIMPVVGRAVGNVDFSNLYVPLSATITRDAAGVLPALADAKKLGAVFAYGNFITVLINFTILAFIIFMMVKAMNTLKKKEAAAPAAPTPPPADVVLLTEIRDLLKK
jgi:large conductance mechanosensitive channel